MTRGWLVVVGALLAATHPVAAGKVPDGAPAAPEGSLAPSKCPVEEYQDAPVVFACDGSSGEVKTRVLLENFREHLDFGVPRGVTDLTVTMEGNFDGDLAIYDPVAGVWVKDLLKQCSQNICKGSYKGMAIEFTATSGKPTAEKAVFSGPIPTSLRLRVQSYVIMGGAEFVIGYSNQKVKDAPCVASALAGCRKYDAVAAREAATQWSRWARYMHKDNVDEAWETLASGYAEIDEVPWHRWCNVWSQWPVAAKQAADCMAVFKFITTGGAEKGILSVDKKSFTFAFDLAPTSTFNSQCCSKVRMTYPDEASAWTAFTATPGPNMYTGIVETIFSVCEALGGNQADTLADHWSRFIEENGQPGMQPQEFHSCWTTGATCPRYNYYRTQALLFGCEPEQGRTPILLPPGSRVVGDIPAGILDLNVTVQDTGRNLDFALKDSGSNSYAVKADGGACNSGLLNCEFHGAKLRWTGKVQQVLGSGSLVSAAFVDATPTPLTLEVNSRLTSVSTAEVTYSYGGYAQCPNQPDADEPPVPAGCSYLDLGKATPKACVEFSSFLELQHSDANGLLQYLTQSGHTQTTALGKGVPFHMWPGVWSDWPEKDQYGQVWQECFHWSDSNHDGLVDESELGQTLLLSRTHDMVDTFCADICKTYPNVDALWANWANGAETILSGSWEALWNLDSKVSSNGISSAHSFRYMDKDGNGAITNDEFKSCYSAGNCGHSLPLLGGILGPHSSGSNILQEHHHMQSKEAQEEQPAPAPAPRVVVAEVRTTLSSDVAAAATALPVGSNVGFQVGRQILIDSGSLQEANEIVNFGSLILKYPLKFAHAAGASISQVPLEAAPSAGTGGGSLRGIPIWVWPVVLVVVVCLGLLIALAAAPFLISGHKRSTVSSIGEGSQADVEHDSAYNNLSLIDSPSRPINADGFANREASGDGMPGLFPYTPSPTFSSYRAGAPATTSMPVMTTAMQPPNMAGNYRNPLSMHTGQQQPLTTFVPFPQRGLPGVGGVPRTR